MYAYYFNYDLVHYIYLSLIMQALLAVSASRNAAKKKKKKAEKAAVEASTTDMEAVSASEP